MNFLQHNQQLNIFNISPQHWSLSPLRLAPVELDISKALLHHFALTNPIDYRD